MLMFTDLSCVICHALRPFAGLLCSVLLFTSAKGTGCGLGVVRFDRTQPIGSDFVKPAKVPLMDDCQEVFDDWFGTYLFSALR
jgi:hypothetical protein